MTSYIHDPWLLLLFTVPMLYAFWRLYQLHQESVRASQEATSALSRASICLESMATSLENLAVSSRELGQAINVLAESVLIQAGAEEFDEKPEVEN